MTTLPARSAATLITAYQRFLSPYKGYCCAHRALNGGLSCSQAIKRLVLRYGLLVSWPLVRARLDSCREAYVELMAQDKEKDITSNGESEYGECPVLEKGFWKSNTTWWCCNLAPLPCSFS